MTAPRATTQSQPASARARATTGISKDPATRTTVGSTAPAAESASRAPCSSPAVTTSLKVATPPPTLRPLASPAPSISGIWLVSQLDQVAHLLHFRLQVAAILRRRPGLQRHPLGDAQPRA